MFGTVRNNLPVDGFYTTLDDLFALRSLPDPAADGDSGYVYGPSFPRSWYVGVRLNFRCRHRTIN